MSLWEIPGNVREFDEDWRVAALGKVGEFDIGYRKVREIRKSWELWFACLCATTVAIVAKYGR